MNILYAASEAVPFCKTGGLADVAGSLPPALAEQGVRTAVMPAPVSAGQRGLWRAADFPLLRLCGSCVAARILRPVFHGKGRRDVVFSG